MTPSIALEGPWPVAESEKTVRRDTGSTVSAKPVGGKGRLRTILGLLDDALSLLLVVFLFPLVILAIGTPVALFVRLLLEIARLL